MLPFLDDTQGRYLPRSKFLPMLGLGLLLSAVSSSMALAVTFATDAHIDGISDPQGPATIGTLTSQVLDFTASDFEFAGPALAGATANDSGGAALGVEGIFFFGQPFVPMDASTTFADQFTNTTGIAQNYVYDFQISGASLAIADYAGMSNTVLPHPNSMFEIGVTASVDGNDDFINSTATLAGGILSHNLATGGSDPLGSTFYSDPSGNIFGYDFDTLNGQFTGVILPGDTLTIMADLSVSVETPGFETGGAAYIGDPFNTSIPGGFSSNLIITPVPEMETWAMMMAGIGFMGWRLRRKQQENLA